MRHTQPGLSLGPVLPNLEIGLTSEERFEKCGFFLRTWLNVGYMATQCASERSIVGSRCRRTRGCRRCVA
jgi:hypothetical protein